MTLTLFFGGGFPPVARDGVQLSRAEDRARYAFCHAPHPEPDGLGDALLCVLSGAEHDGPHFGFDVAMRGVVWQRESEPDRRYWPTAAVDPDQMVDLGYGGDPCGDLDDSEMPEPDEGTATEGYEPW